MTPATGYLERLLAAVRNGNLPRGNFTQVEVEHGPGCRQSPCTCHPRITAIVGEQVLTIGTGGAVLERRQRS